MSAPPLRAIGMTSGREQAVIVANAGLLGLLVGGVAMLGGLGLTYLWSLGSAVFYGITIHWGSPEISPGMGRDYSDVPLRSRIVMSRTTRQRNRPSAGYCPPSIIAWAQAMCPSKPRDSAIAR